MGVSQENNGYYECVARDGYHLLEDGEASYFYIKASQRAQLQVIGKFSILPKLIVIRKFPSLTCFACMALKVSEGVLL